MLLDLLPLEQDALDEEQPSGGKVYRPLRRGYRLPDLLVEGESTFAAAIRLESFGLVLGETDIAVGVTVTSQRHTGDLLAVVIAAAAAIATEDP